MSMLGARQGTLSGLRKLAAAAMARDLRVLAVPGPEIARVRGLDISAAGLQVVSSPRHASVLLLVGEMPPTLLSAATVVYAQMMRPRALFVLGEGETGPLPPADVRAPLSPEGLVAGVVQLRDAFAKGAFRTATSDFDAPALGFRVEYVCPMHPEVIRDEPGDCPKCGMTLMPREASSPRHDTGHGDHVGHEGHGTHGGQDGQTAGDDHDGHGQVGDHRSHHGHDDDDGAATHGTAAEDYTCSMHPEVSQPEPGKCPKCGMTLVPRSELAEGAEHGGHGQHSDHAPPDHKMQGDGGDHGSAHDAHGTMDHGDANRHSTQTGEHAAHSADRDDTNAGMDDYTCSMHPEVSRAEPGKCPECGMTLVPRAELAVGGEHRGHGRHADHASHGSGVSGNEDDHGSSGHLGDGGDYDGADHASMDHSVMDNSGMDHAGMDHAGMGFMSMVDVTKDLPRSGDGLPMEWIDAPFGPFFPGLPGGLSLILTLDGDTIARAEASALPDRAALVPSGSMTPDAFVARLSGLVPLAPTSYALLARRATEAVTGVEVPGGVVRGRIVALERERIASHLNWLALFGYQNGLGDLAMRAGSLQLAIAQADVAAIEQRGPALQALCDRALRVLLLKARLAGIGRLAAADDLRGPVSRASGGTADCRSDDPASVALGFAPVSVGGGDALARLRQHIDEIRQSVALIAAAGSIAAAGPVQAGAVSGQGAATIETPRGAATLQVTLEAGKVTAATIGAPSVRHLELVPALCDQQELGDALVAIGSLDLCPWEARL